mmetsp:Transcript_36354/g.113341  ORF Transcript_36354/g.113341 Transcript_36354/m.113341 type:complete len:256 (-) Transcript_36354:102-869(-)
MAKTRLRLDGLDGHVGERVVGLGGQPSADDIDLVQDLGQLRADLLQLRVDCLRWLHAHSFLPLVRVAQAMAAAPSPVPPVGRLEVGDAHLLGEVLSFALQLVFRDAHISVLVVGCSLADVGDPCKEPLGQLGVCLVAHHLRPTQISSKLSHLLHLPSVLVRADLADRPLADAIGERELLHRHSVCLGRSAMESHYLHLVCDGQSLRPRTLLFVLQPLSRRHNSEPSGFPSRLRHVRVSLQLIQPSISLHLICSVH